MKPETIIEVVSTYYSHDPDTISGPSRIASVARARHVVMYLLRESGLSYERIGQWLGDRDHTTVMHGVATIESRQQTDEELKGQLSVLRMDLRRQKQNEKETALTVPPT